MKIRIDGSRCCGHGRCYVTAPDLFTNDQCGYGQVRDQGEVAAALLEAASQAVRECPERAITLIDEPTQAVASAGGHTTGSENG